jgi:hypothetical protein
LLALVGFGLLLLQQVVAPAWALGPDAAVASKQAAAVRALTAWGVLHPTEEDFAVARWRVPLTVCANPAGGPAVVPPAALVRAVADAVAAWRDATDGVLPIAATGMCAVRPDLSSTPLWARLWTRPPLESADPLVPVGWDEADGQGLAYTRVWTAPIAGDVRREVQRAAVALHAPSLARVLATDADPPACLQAVVRHELGHVVGLDHAHASPRALLRDRDGRCDDDVHLDAADVRNVRALYPTGR